MDSPSLRIKEARPDMPLLFLTAKSPKEEIIKERELIPEESDKTES
jgi:hypothetical protein